MASSVILMHLSFPGHEGIYAIPNMQDRQKIGKEKESIVMQNTPVFQPLFKK